VGSASARVDGERIACARLAIVPVDREGHREDLAAPAGNQEDVGAAALARGRLLDLAEVRPSVPPVAPRGQHESVCLHDPPDALAIVDGTKGSVQRAHTWPEPSDRCGVGIPHTFHVRSPVLGGMSRVVGGQVIAWLWAAVLFRHLVDPAQAALVRPRMGRTSLKALPKADGTPWGFKPVWERGRPRTHGRPLYPGWRPLSLADFFLRQVKASSS
jgi:hypothetical protein